MKKIDTQAVMSNKKYTELVRRRHQTIRILLLVLVIATLGFPCLSTYAPQLMARPVTTEFSISFGFLYAFVLIMLCLLTCWYYAWFSNTKLEQQTEEVLAEIRSEY